jgi:TolA-binding protein
MRKRKLGSNAELLPGQQRGLPLGEPSASVLMPRKSPRSRVTKSGVAVLQQLGDRISACLERAEQCREAAASEVDERVRQQLLDLEQQWQQVAENYQFMESLLLDQRALPPEIDMLPKDFPPE